MSFKIKCLCVLALVMTFAHTASAQHKAGVMGAVITKYGITEKFFLNQYAEYCNDFTNNTGLNYCILKPLGVGYTFTNWFTVDFGYYYFQFINSGMHRPELSLIFTHREGNFQLQYQKRVTMDKNTRSSYYDWFHRSHFTVSYDIPKSRFTPVATFEFYLKNGLKMGRFHGGTHISLTEKSQLSVQIFQILSPGNKYQEFYLYAGYIFTL